MIFLTGGTGYLGSYVLTELLDRTDQTLAVLVRAKDADQAREKLWNGLQLHLSAEQFLEVEHRFHVVYGDLHSPGLGIDPAQRRRLVEETESVLHIAASLNRKSERACVNTNLRGTLHVLNLAREIHRGHGLRRFSEVSTVAVAGSRRNEVVLEDEAIDWERADYDPYGRTKKFCEYMLDELLPDVRHTVFRPSMVIGDSRHGRTSQFDMVGAVIGLADAKVVPVNPDWRMDVVNADWVGRAIAAVHLDEGAKHTRYHLSSGKKSPTAGQICSGLSDQGVRVRFVPTLAKGAGYLFRAGDRLPRSQAQRVAATMKVFWPYVTYDTVFDNARAVDAIGEPAFFPDYVGPLYQWVKEHRFKFPFQPVPARRRVA